MTQTFEQRWAGESCDVIRAELDRIAPPGMMIDGPKAELAFALAELLKQRGNTDVPGLSAQPIPDGAH